MSVTNAKTMKKIRTTGLGEIMVRVTNTEKVKKIRNSVVLFPTRAQAKRALEFVRISMDDYGVFSMGDLKMLADKTVVREDENWGWTVLPDNLSVKKETSGWSLTLPLPESI